MNTNLMSIDGDGQAQTNDASQGIPFGVQTINAPAGSDAAAMLALAVPVQTTASTTPIDLEFVLPPGFAVVGGDGSACSTPSSTSSYLPWILAGLLALWMVR